MIKSHKKIKKRDTYNWMWRDKLIIKGLNTFFILVI